MTDWEMRMVGLHWSVAEEAENLMWEAEQELKAAEAVLGKAREKFALAKKMYQLVEKMGNLVSDLDEQAGVESDPEYARRESLGTN